MWAGSVSSSRCSLKDSLRFEQHLLLASGGCACLSRRSRPPRDASALGALAGRTPTLVGGVARAAGAARLSEVILPPAHVFDDPALAFERERAGHDVVEESAVVADEQHRAVEVARSAPRAARASRCRDRWWARRAPGRSPGCANSRASIRRLRSPPESDLTGDTARSRGNRKSAR